MRKKLIRNGNSKALILDQTMLAHLKVNEAVEVQLLKGRIVLLRPADHNETADRFIDQLSTESRHSTSQCQKAVKRAARLNDGRAGNTHEEKKK